MSESETSGKKLILIASITGLILVIGFILIFKFADTQRNQDLNAWRDRLNIVADSRASAVSAWLNRHLKSVEDVSRDATLQFYVTDMTLAEGSSEGDAQRGYVFSLLSAEAERQGFHEVRPLDSVAANVQRPRRAGFAIISDDGKALVATNGMPFIGTEAWIGKSRSFINLLFIEKAPFLVFGTPISAPEGMDLAGNRTWLIGAKPLNDEFFAELKQPGILSETSETYLVMAGDKEGHVRPLSPLSEGGRIGSNRADKAATYAMNQPGAFSITSNYSGTEVLVTGRELSSPVPWVLVRTVTAKEALSEINARRNELIFSLSLAVLVVLVMIAFAWRYGISKRLASSYAEQANLSAKNEALSRFLQSVSDSQSSAIAAIDNDFKIRFANKEMGNLAQVPAPDLMNRRLETAFSADDAKLIRATVQSALEGSQSQTVLDFKKEGASRSLKLQTVPMDQDSGAEGQALIVLQDITDLVTARKRAEGNLKQLVSTLTQIIDARDPWSKYHSKRVSEVSMAVAAEMGWGMRDIETVRTAGQLMNLGKIFVPPEILTKHTPLNDEELELVRESVDKGANLLEGLEFGGPVAESLKQVREHWDGSGGPAGKAGDDILREARILSVANAFVGMVSSRAHRSGFDFDKAASFLIEDSGSRYDRKVVAALQNILENKGGRDRWAHYGEAVEE